MSKYAGVTVGVLSVQGWRCWGPQHPKGVCGMEVETNGLGGGETRVPVWEEGSSGSESRLP